MIDELAKLVYDNKSSLYSYSSNFYSKAVDVILKNYGIGNVSLKSKQNLLPLAQYNTFNREIVYNDPKIILDGAAYIKKSKKSTSDNYYYLYVLYILLHEIEHVRQHDIIEHENSIEGKIVFASINALEKYSNRIFKNDDTEINFLKLNEYGRCLRLITKMYSYSPRERLANYKAAVSTIEIARLLKDEESDLIFSGLCISGLVEAYGSKRFNKTFSPTEYYLEKLDFNEDMSEIHEMSYELSEFDKIKYGFSADKKLINDTIELERQINKRCKKI